ncbi:MAG: hypothetical protein ACE5JG_03330 [Planctomycetota bacterium]
MSPFVPTEDPAESGSFLDQTFDRIRSNPFLKVLLLLTLVDDLCAVLLAVAGRLPATLAGSLILLSTLAWFFGVALPTLNRELRAQTGRARWSYVGDLVEMFGRVLLCTAILLFTATLVMRAAAA